MNKLPLDPSENSFSELAQHVIVCIDVLEQKIGVHDDGLILDRLRLGDCARTPGQLAEVDPFPGDATSRLAEYNRHIALAEEALQKLKSTRDGFKRSIDLTQSLLAPIRRLPEDILVEIFSLYVQGSGTQHGSKERTYSLTVSRDLYIFSPSFTLSGVCSFWRKVVFSRPTFWTSFSLNLRALRAFEGGPKVTTILSECLLRSANTPLSLYIEADIAYDDSNREDAFVLFLEQAARWEHLNLFFSYHKSISQFISYLQSRDKPPIFSNLRHLDLDGKFYGAATSPFPILRLLQGSRLETLSTGRFDLPWSDFSQYDFSSLKKFETFEPSGGSIEQFFGRMSSLEVCKLNSTFGFTADEKHANTSYLSNLRRLSICLDRCPVEAWQSLRTPHLASLSLQAGDSAELSHIEDFSLMLVRSKSVLQELTLCDLFDHEAVDFISTHPSVADMTLSGNYNDDEDSEYPGNLFSCMNCLNDQSEAILGPNLLSLAVQIKGYRTGPAFPRSLAQNIVDMVMSRANAESLPPGVSALKKFSLRINTNYEEIFDHIRTSLAHLVASGLELQLDERIIAYSGLKDS